MSWLLVGRASPCKDEELASRPDFVLAAAVSIGISAVFWSGESD